MYVKRRRIAVLLLVLQCLVIFSFSAQPAESSSKTSKSVTRKILSVLPIVKKASTETAEKFLDKAETVVRKLAHFSLFLLLGIYAYLAMDGYLNKRKIAAALLFCLLYAASDELHQLFIAGRSCEARDVCIDFAGSLCGVYITLFVQKIIVRRKSV